jgi:hypothetical protein
MSNGTTFEPPLTPADRQQRIVLLCCNFMRNLALHRAGLRCAAVRDNLLNRYHPQGEFWVQAHGNFLDTCVLDWCKLFVDYEGEHHWHRVVADRALRARFKKDLYKTLGVRGDEFTSTINEVKHYRDKFVAHLDEERTMLLPAMELARKAVLFLDERLAPQLPDEWRGLPASAEQRASQQAESVYVEALRATPRL